MNWKTDNTRWGMLLVLGLLLVSILITLLSWVGAATPKKRVREELQAIQDNKLTEAYYAFTSKEFQAATSLEDFKKFIKSLPSLTQHPSIQLEDLPDQNDLKIVKGVLEGNDEKLTLHFQLIKQDDQWKILNIKAIPSALADAQIIEQKYEDVLFSLDQFLNDVNEGDLEQAYNHLTNSEFKTSSSLKSFKEFISQFSIFRSFIDFEVVDVAEKDHATIVKTKLQNLELITLVDFTFVQEKNRWLIRGIQIVSQKNTPNAVPDFDPADLIKPIQGHLDALQKSLFKEAYQNFMAEAFQQTTSLDEFEKFVKGYPFFLHKHKTDFYKLTFNNNVAMYRVEIKAENGEKREVEYALIKENGAWKIIQIQVFDKI